MTHMTHTSAHGVPWPGFVAATFTVAALTLLAALAGGLEPLPTAPAERAAAEAVADMPDWRGNSARVPGDR